LFAESTVVNEENIPYNLDKGTRDSWTAYLHETIPEENPGHLVVKCIEERASLFQGHIPIENLEPLQVVKYITRPNEIFNPVTRYLDSQHFREHFDWFEPENVEVELHGNRASSFFVYLVANCTEGTTAFPEVPRPKQPEWCDILKCEDENGYEVDRLEVKPKVGTAIFWYNLHPSGEGDHRTLHAGLPVKEGKKVGLNIWTRERKVR